MKALVYHGPGKSAWDTRPRPVLERATDDVFGNAAKEKALKVLVRAV